MTKKLTILYIISLISLMTFGQEYRISKQGREFIQNVEKCSLERYWDNGAYSIGYGHRMTPGMKQYKKITRRQAEQLLKEDLCIAERTANKILKELRWQPSQSFYDGLVSVIYNCGQCGIYKTEFYKRLKNCRQSKGIVNKNDLNFTVAAIKDARIPSGRYANGVKDRRYAEHKLMLQ